MPAATLTYCAGMVNRTNGPLDEQLHERHDARDFDTQTEDKRQA